MARITGSASEKVFQIQKWLGLNENPDGDTKLKMGEAAAMRNFRVTRDGNLQKRPGTRAQWTVVADSPIETLWTGFVAGTLYVMAICNGKLYSLGDEGAVTEIGAFSGSTDHPHMFGFSDKLYILTGSKYYVYDGTTLAEVVGYVPLVAVAVTPAGGGELLEQVNKLSNGRRVWVSPDGTSTTFKLPETYAAVTAVRKTSDNSIVTGYTPHPADGTVEFDSAPEAGTSTLEIEYTVANDFRSQVEGMRFSETYNGTQDSRVFLYGDGSNKALYSDIDHDGQSRADYFPDQNEVRVGVENTPITGMIRHYSALAVFKTDGTYGIQYGNVTLATGDIIPAFYVSPVNRAIGNEAPGQVQLVLNNPYTLFGQDVYEWRNSSYYSSNLTRDERQARRISDRVFATIHTFDTQHCVCFDDNYHQEYYIVNPDGRALVHGYATDAWYYYTNFPAKCFVVVDNELYYGANDGKVYKVSGSYNYDQRDGEITAIDCYWESGAMSFGSDYQRKNSAMLWIGIKPEAKASIDVTALTDKDATYPTKTVDYSLFDFEHIDFADFTFSTNDKPQMRRLKIKPKKFVFYKLIFKTTSDNTSVTVTSADIRIRFMGYHK